MEKWFDNVGIVKLIIGIAEELRQKISEQLRDNGGTSVL